MCLINMCVPIPLTIHKVNYLLKSSREEADWINKQLCTLTEEFGIILDWTQNLTWIRI